MNTARKGKVRYIVFKEGDTWYGVALEFNIVVEGDSAAVVNFNLQEAIRGYIESMRKINGFPLNHEKGRHHFYIGTINGKLPEVCVPYHGKTTFKPRTFKEIVLQSGL